MDELEVVNRKKEPKKRYASNQDLARTWLMRALMIGVGVVALMSLYRFGQGAYLLFAGSDGENLIWSTKQGVGYCAKGGVKTALYKLHQQNGEPVEYPKFAVVGDSFVYYSPPDASVCVLTPGQPGKWISLSAAGFQPNMKCKHMLPSANGVTVTGWTGAGSVEGHRDKDLYLNAKILAKAEVSPDTGSVIMLNPTDEITDPTSVATSIKNAGGGKFTMGDAPLAKVESAPINWAYDFTTKALVANDGGQIYVVTPSGKHQWSIGPLYYMQNISLTTVPGAVCIEGVKPINAGYMLLSYGYDGTFKNYLVKDKDPILAPFLKAPAGVVEMLKSTGSD